MASERVQAFIDAVSYLMEEHGLCISHEDGHGAFLIEHLDHSILEWFRAAEDRTGATSG